MRLVAPDGDAIDLQGVTAKDQSVAIAVPGTLSRGTHLLSWRVISADGHPVGGTVAFSVLEPSAAPPMLPRSEIDRPLQIAMWLCKVLLYCGLMFGIGGAFYAAWIAKVAARRRAAGVGLVQPCRRHDRGDLIGRAAGRGCHGAAAVRHSANRELADRAANLLRRDRHHRHRERSPSRRFPAAKDRRKNGAQRRPSLRPAPRWL